MSFISYFTISGGHCLSRKENQVANSIRSLWFTSLDQRGATYLLKTAETSKKQEQNCLFVYFFLPAKCFLIVLPLFVCFFTLLKEIFVRSSSHCRQISQTQRPTRRDATQRNANFGWFGCLLQLLFEVFGFDFVGQTHTETGWVTYACSPIQAQTWIQVTN